MGLLSDLIAYKLAYDKEQREAARDREAKMLATQALDREYVRPETVSAPPILPRQEETYNLASKVMARETPQISYQGIPEIFKAEQIKKEITPELKTEERLLTPEEIKAASEGKMPEVYLRPKTQQADIPIQIYDEKTGTLSTISSYKGKAGTKPTIVTKKATETFEDVMNKVNQLYGGEIPPGTTVTKGGVSVPLKPVTTPEQGAVLSAAESASKNIDELSNLIVKEPSTAKFLNLMASQYLPYWAISGNTEEVKRLRDRIQVNVVTARGGKQLTPTEIKFLDKLLPVAGQKPETMLKNLTALKNEIQASISAATQGRDYFIGQKSLETQQQSQQKQEIKSKYKDME